MYIKIDAVPSDKDIIGVGLFGNSIDNKIKKVVVEDSFLLTFLKHYGFRYKKIDLTRWPNFYFIIPELDIKQIEIIFSKQIPLDKQISICYGITPEIRKCFMLETSLNQDSIYECINLEICSVSEEHKSDYLIYRKRQLEGMFRFATGIGLKGSFLESIIIAVKQIDKIINVN